MVARVGQDRRCQQFVAVDELLERRDPVVVVLPWPAFGFRGALPLPDRRDQGFLEFTPRVVAELGQRERQSESSALPFVIELRRRLIGGAGLVQLHDCCPASATPIIDSVVTRSISISSVKSSVPKGLSGITNQRECPLESHTLISVSAGRSTPTSASTLRGSRATRDRNVGSLYQYGGSPSTGQGKHEHSVQITRLCTPAVLATACRCSPSAPAMPSGKSISAIAAGVSVTIFSANSGSVQAFTTIFLPLSGVISVSKYASTLSTVCGVMTPFSISNDSNAAAFAALASSRSGG